GSFVDLGCGSGVLAIVAARLGFAPVLALDFDPAAVEAATANARANGVSLDVRRFDVRFDDIPVAPVVVANLLGALLLDWADRPWAEAPERLIASGLLATEADRVATAFAAHGLAERERLERGEWAALSLISQL
ncbi:MAG TPA: 50S ribosomal protein L11 methyltransferase, partial [Solirubrobacteraceae bacterium]|nr:50S ribosomal protein L11 methyltransferase [Solirubrobacteraceae bacterium]